MQPGANHIRHNAIHYSLEMKADLIYKAKNIIHGGRLEFDAGCIDIDALRKALKESKGPGNFRNLFMYAPAGKKDGIQVIPLAEVAAKDEFASIKNVTRDDQLAMQRVPPQLMGILPNNTGGFGDVEKAARVFAINELAPLQERLMEINDWVGEEVIRFKPYELLAKQE